MKSFLLVACCLVFSLSYCQSPVLSWDWIPQAGEQFVLQPAHSSGVQQGSAGMDQFWDFTTLSDSAGAQITHYLLPGETLYSDSFPLSNLASIESDSSHHYFMTSQSEVLFSGTISPIFEIYLSNPAQRFVFPFEYGSSFTDSLSGVLNFSGFLLVYTGTVEFSADGYGTLDLPDGRSFSNALRYRYVENTEASQNGEWVFQSMSESVVWVSPDCPEPLLSINSFSQLNSTGQFESRSVYYSKGVFTSVDDYPLKPDIQFSVYPNPSDGKIKLRLGYSPEQTKHVRLLDLWGRISDEIVFQGKEFNWEPDFKATGLYILELKTENQRITEKILLLR